jgi:hypothetical protein
VQSSPMHASAHATVQGRQAPVPRQISRAKSEAETAEGRALVGERNVYTRGNVVCFAWVGGCARGVGARGARCPPAHARTHTCQVEGGELRLTDQVKKLGCGPTLLLHPRTGAKTSGLSSFFAKFSSFREADAGIRCQTVSNTRINHNHSSNGP